MNNHTDQEKKEYYLRRINELISDYITDSDTTLFGKLEFALRRYQQLEKKLSKPRQNWDSDLMKELVELRKKAGKA